MKKSLMILMTALVLATQALAAAEASIPRPEYPRPQFERADWVNLNGTWTYTFDFGRSGLAQNYAASEGFDGRITVPFCPESKLSGVGYTDFIGNIWYQRSIQMPQDWAESFGMPYEDYSKRQDIKTFDDMAVFNVELLMRRDKVERMQELKESGDETDEEGK